jgi:hypothetical protein
VLEEADQLRPCVTSGTVVGGAGHDPVVNLLEIDPFPPGVVRGPYDQTASGFEDAAELIDHGGVLLDVFEDLRR